LRAIFARISNKKSTLCERAGAAAGWGIFLFVFLMVLREGVELALILRAVELSSDGLQTWIGTILGLAAGNRRRPFLFQGHRQNSSSPFFRADRPLSSGWLPPQLAITGLHELSEARWLPSSKQEMAFIGLSFA